MAVETIVRTTMSKDAGSGSAPEIEISNSAVFVMNSLARRFMNS
jgi:hypothetical protein